MPEWFARPLVQGALAITTVVWATGLTAQQGAPLPDPDPIDPVAVEILTDASDYLAAQDAMSFSWFVSWDVVVDGREKITYMRSGANLLSRGVGFYSFAEDDDRLRLYYFDGAAFTVVAAEDQAFAQVPFAGTFDDLAGRVRAEYDIALPVWEVMSSDPGAALLEATEAAAYLGVARVGGEPAHHLAFAQYDQDWQIWISTDQDAPIVLAIVGTDPYAQGWPQYRVYFTDWDFQPDVAADAFRFEPDDDMIRMSWPKVEDAARAEAAARDVGARSETQEDTTDDQ